MKKYVSILMAAFCLFTLSMGASASTKGDLTGNQALKLAKSARQHYWDVIGGHIQNAKHSTCSSTHFQYKGTDYRYFCSELNTKKKLVQFLNQIFTLNAIEKGISKYKFIVYHGKMIQPDADGGSLMNWDKSKTKLIYQRKDIRLFQFTVPLGDTIEMEKQNVTFIKVRGHWLINAIDAVE